MSAVQPNEISSCETQEDPFPFKRKLSEPFSVSLVNGSESLTESKSTSVSSSGYSSGCSSGSYASELRSEEAELAAVIAKVTGRASPFVNESDGGERKFTILCGDAANPADGCDNDVVPSAVSAKYSADGNLPLSFGGVELRKLEETGKVVDSSDKDNLFKIATTEAKISAKESDMQEMKPNLKSCDAGEAKESNAVMIKQQSNPGQEAVDQVVIDQVVVDREPVDREPVDRVGVDRVAVDQVMKSDEDLTKITNRMSAKINATDTMTCNIFEDKDDQTLTNDGYSTPKEEILDYEMPNRVDKSNGSSNFENKTETESLKEAVTVRACFPAVQSKVPGKSFEMNSSPEVHQNVINRRMAARNATAIAEFDPLVTMSYEAQRLAMWHSTKELERKEAIDESDAHSTPKDGTSIINVHTSMPSDGKDVDAAGTGKASPQPVSHQPSKDKRIAKEENAAMDSELGDNKDVPGYESAINRQWIISLALMVLISIAIFVPLMLMNFAGPWWLAAPVEEDIGGSSGDSADNLPVASQKAFQDSLQIARKDKAVQGGFVDSNADDIFGGGVTVPEETSYGDHRHGIVENSDKEKIRDKNIFFSLLSEDNRHVFNQKPKPYTTICSYFEDYAVEILCQKTKPSVLKLVLKYIARSQDSGDIVLTEYIQMYRYLNSFLSSLGGFASIQTKMLEERLKQLEDLTLGERGADYQKLFQMIYSEVTYGTVGKLDPFSGTILFTCLHRHLQFLTLALENVLTLGTEESLQPAFEAAYEKVLSSHHTWLVEMIYEVGMNMLPTKEHAATLLSIRQVEKFSLYELQESLQIVIRQLKTLNDASEGVLIQTNALQVIPKQVIA